jgi:pyruvate/2-oxoglutarate dehydrogenase complex dihydrolipoamide dehydrogenase (E3) component
MVEPFDVVVIGGGTAGLVTASGCARLGRRVALIEKEALGGDCLWTGCVPTKALVASARLAHQMRHAAQWGLPAHEPALVARAVMDSMRGVRQVISRHDAAAKFRGLGIDVIEGQARLVSRSRVEVAGRTLEGRDIVIATGSRTAVPQIAGLQETGFIDHATFLDRNDFPATVLILGGGAIGVEFAQILQRFGSKATIVEMADQILSKEDADVSVRMREILREERIEIRTGWRVTAIAGKVARVESHLGEPREIPFDELFVASGRRGNVDDLGLDEQGVKTSGSYVAVDKYLQTSVPRIWACGDVHGGPQFTHAAAYEAVKLVRNMLFPGRSAVSYDNVPWALYTDPEVAHLGMTEAEARAAVGEENVRTYAVDMGDVDRAVVDRTPRGFTKIVCDRKGRILGAHIVSTNASTLIEQLVLARAKKARIGELAQLVAPYPSLADAIQKAAAQHYQAIGESWIGTVGRRLAALSQ